MANTYRFGEFELDLDAQQLKHGGEAVHLERRPFDLLVMLVTHRDRLVTREEIVAALWPSNVIIDFDAGVNTLIRKLRAALHDSPDQPVYIRTNPGKGYRFIAPVIAPGNEPVVEPAIAPVTEPLNAPETVPAVTIPDATPVPVEEPSRTQLPAFALIVALVAVLAGGLALVNWQTVPENPAPTRIAILPFENLTGDDRYAYLASGIAEDTNNALAEIDLPNLSVIGVVSTRALADGALSVQKIGAELGADFVVLSALRFDGSRLRLTSRLLRARDGEQVWSASFDRTLTNLLGLQRDLSIAIAEQIRQRLSPDVAAEIDSRQTRNPEAYELYLRGRNEWMQFQPGSISRAIGYYEQAVQKDPGYALAWAGIAHALITSPVTADMNRQEVYSAARDALQRALEYGTDLAETQLALGSFHFFLDDNLPAAEESARRAVALGPNSAMAHMFLGIVLMQVDKHIEARAMLRRARELDPLFPLMFANSAIVALMGGDAQEALEHATQAVAIKPDFWPGHLHLGNVRMALGDLEGAVEAFEDADRFSGGFSARTASLRVHALARLGRQDEARVVLEDLIDYVSSHDVSPYHVAVAYAGLDDNDAAFEWLDREVGSGGIWCLDLEGDRMLESLRSEMRFESLLNRCMAARRSVNGE